MAVDRRCCSRKAGQMVEVGVSKVINNMCITGAEPHWTANKWGNCFFSAYVLVVCQPPVESDCLRHMQACRGTEKHY